MTLTGETVTGGTINLSVQSSGHSLFQGNFDLCDQLQKVGLSCPLAPGKYKVFKQLDIPFIP